MRQFNLTVVDRQLDERQSSGLITKPFRTGLERI
jgi:hypothetical protein